MSIENTTTHENRREKERRAEGRSLADVEVAFNKALQDHEDREAARMTDRITVLINQLKEDAFPDTPEQHRAAHQAMIDAAVQQQDFLKWLKMEIAKKSIWGILQILVFLCLAGLAAKFGLNIPFFK